MRVETYVISLTVLAGAAAYSIHLTSFLHAKELVFALGAAVLGTLQLRNGRISSASLWLVAPFAAALMWALLLGALGKVSLGNETLIEVLRWTSLLLFAGFAFPVLLHEEGRLAVGRAIVASAALAALLAILQYSRLFPYFFPDFGGTAPRLYSVFGNAGLLGGYLAAAFPLALRAALRPCGKGLVSLVLLGLIAVGLLLSGTRSAWIAAVVGAILVLATTKSTPRRFVAVGAIFAVLVSLLCLIAPEVTSERLMSLLRSGDAGRSLRTWFWFGTLRMVEDHLLFGVGPGNYGAWSARYLGGVLWEPGGEHLAHNLLHTRHAHCDPLELLAEFGVVGVLPLLLWWGRLVRCRGPEWGGLLSLAVFSLAYFPFYSAPHAIVGLLLAGCLLGRSLNNTEGAGTSAPSMVSRLASWTAGVAAVLLVPLALWMVVIPSYLLRLAEDLHVGGADPLSAYERVIALRWAPAECYEKYGLALLEADRHDEARVAFQTACTELDTGAAYLGLGASSLFSGDVESARDALESCLKRWPSSYEAWALLIDAYPLQEREAILTRARAWLTDEELERVNKPAATEWTAPATDP